MTLNHPEDQIIWFNNSSIPRLNCGRQFVLQNVVGLRTQASESMNFGSVFHHFMRVIEPGDQEFHLLFMKGPPKSVSETLSTDQLQRAAAAAISGAALLGFDSHVREEFFAFRTDEHLINPAWLPPGHIVVDAGTIDRLEVMLVSGYPHIVITDYKTTYKKLSNGSLHLNYMLSGQLKFYAAALRRAAREGKLAGTSYEHYQDLAAQGFFARRYLFVNSGADAEKPSDRLLLQQPAIIPEAELDEYDTMLRTMRDMFVYYTVNPQTALKTGQLNNMCWSCKFPSICIEPNDAGVERAVSAWPLGRARFNPRHGDDE